MTESADQERALREFRDREREQVSPLWVLAVLLRERKTLLRFTATGGLLALLIALLRPPTYTTTFSFTPQASEAQDRAGLASLAGQFGVNLGGLTAQAQSPEFYADLFTTRAILAPIAQGSYSVSEAEPQAVRLSELLGETGHDEAVVLENTMRVLRDKIVKADIAGRTTGVVSVRVRTKSRQVSYQVAQGLLHELNQFNLRAAQAQAAAERQFLEGRVAEARLSLRAAEDALQVFLQANRQVANSPELTFRLERLQREVNLQQQLMLGLAQQYEDARIREVRDTPAIAIVEQPTIAARSDPRKRILILAAGISFAFLVVSCVVLIRHSTAQLVLDDRDPATSLLATEWSRFRGRE